MKQVSSRFTGSARVSDVVAITFVAVSAAACHEVPVLTAAACDAPCYTGPEVTLNIGVCGAGRAVCGPGGEVIECRGEITPASELCNGVDDDCDGAVDELPEDATLGAECGEPARGRCTQGHYACDGGEVVCHRDVEPAEEVCNNVDDDCDGSVDNLKATTFCYEGAIESLAFGPCHPGVIACMGGRTICANQRLPEEESCNGRDDNCDGQVDEGVLLGSDTQIDVVLMIDRSGSMRLDRRQIIAALESLSDRFAGDPRYRFSILSVPGERAYETSVETDFLPAGDLRPFVGSLAPDRGAGEPTYDAPFEVATGEIPLAWRDASARIQIMFTDEEGQSYRAEALEESQVAETLATFRQRFYGFTRPSNRESFDELARTSGGDLFELADASSIERDLTGALERCVP